MARRGGMGDPGQVRITSDSLLAWSPVALWDGAWAAALLTLLVALCSGRRLALGVALAVTAGEALSVAAAWLDPSRASALQFIVEGAVLSVLIGAALFSRPYWVLFAAAFQLLAFATRAAMLLKFSWPVEPALQVWTWALVGALAAGALRRPAIGAPLSQDRRSPLL